MELGRVRVEHTNGGSVVLTHFFSSWFMTDDRIDGIAVYLERTSMNISNSRISRTAASHPVTRYPRDKVVGVGLVATHQPGVDRVAEQASNGDVMNFDLG